MKRPLIWALLAASVGWCLATPARACDFTLCDSYGYYDPDSNEIFGYSYTADYSGWMFVAVSGDLSGPQGQVVHGSGDWNWGESWAYYYLIPPLFGVFDIHASHFWSSEPYYWYYYDGTTDYEFDGYPPLPYDESTISKGSTGLSGYVGGQWLLHLVPESNQYYYDITESLFGSTDTCYSIYGGKHMQEPQPFYDSVAPYGVFTDDIAVIGEWVDHYRNLVDERGCGWSVQQWVIYAYNHVTLTSFGFKENGVYFDPSQGNSVVTYRGYDTYP